MRIVRVVILCFIGLGSAYAQKPKETSKSIEKREEELELLEDLSVLDSISEIYDQYEYMAHYGAFVDFAPDVEDSVIIARINSVQSDIPLRFDSKIRGFIDYFTIRNRDYTRKMIKRSEVYFPIIEDVLAKNNMPQSLKYLAIVESGLDPKIRSWAGAMGLWQFMPATGKSFNLNYDYYIDERLNPYKSTEAACKYLKQLYGMFGDWELALGAYNCGPGNMRKAIRNSGGKTTFSEVYNFLPKETRSYVPQFMAVNYVMRFAPEHNLYVEDWEGEYLPESDTIICNQYINIDKLCELTGICASHFIRLNPEIKRNAISADWKNYPLVVPKEFTALGKDSIQSLLILVAEKGEEDPNYAYKNETSTSSSSSSTTSKITHKVKSGENLGLIASKYGTNVTNVKKWNNLKNSTIYPGQRLSIYVTTVKPSTTSTPKTETKEVVKTETVSKPVTISEGNKIYYIVKSGDALGIIASKNGTTVTQLKEWNKLSSTNINIGQKLIVGYAKEVENNTSVKTNEKVYYTVKSGDALSTIASRNGSSIEQIKKWNNLTSTNIQVGQKLVVANGDEAKKEEPKQETKTEVKSETKPVIKTETKPEVKVETKPETKPETKTEVKPIEKTAVTETQKPLSTELKTNQQNYVVLAGESLFSIAKKFDMPVAELKSLNNLSSDAISVGQKLIVTKPLSVPKTEVSSANPYSGKTYTVQTGDTLWSITKKFEGVSVDELKKLNNLTSNELKVGQVLKLG